MKFQTLFSGSKGNCALIQNGKYKMMVDCGCNASAIEKMLKDNGVSPGDISAVFVTHEHSDHVSGLSCFCARHKIDVFVHEKCAYDIEKLLPTGHNPVTFNGKGFEHGGLSVHTYDCEHDSMHCSGFKFENSNGAVAVITDLGRATDALFGFVKDCDLMLIESNHDEVMLAGGSYPLQLKKRIAGVYGHLSNRQTGEILQRLPALNVRNVWLGHLSLKNNTPEIAFQSAVGALGEKHITEGKDIFVDVVGQYRPSRVFEK